VNLKTNRKQPNQIKATKQAKPN